MSERTPAGKSTTIQNIDLPTVPVHPPPVQTLTLSHTPNPNILSVPQPSISVNVN